MKTDLYTKAVLTVIAFALICIVFQNANPVSSIYASEDIVNAPSVIKSETSSSCNCGTLYNHYLPRQKALPVYIVEDPNKKEVTEE